MFVVYYFTFWSILIQFLYYILNHVCVCVLVWPCFYVWTPACCGACITCRSWFSLFIFRILGNQTQIVGHGSKYHFCGDTLLAITLIFTYVQHVAQRFLFACRNPVLYVLQCCVFVHCLFFFLKKNYSKGKFKRLHQTASCLWLGKFVLFPGAS